ncbi:MAG: ribbon-helix-helix protein, CopG family [Rhodocyclales bacterium]|nr:ribbon-helix-helix protein, CopG family [Rhodocyclales bacterium]
MTDKVYQRFAISMPPAMADQVEQACRREGRSRSEFFREAVRTYLALRASGALQPRLVLPSDSDERLDDPFHAFTEWASEADSVYDRLG